MSINTNLSTTEKTWDEFLNLKLLWWVNRSLQMFGWVIMLETDDETGKVTRAYPARTIYRGFCEKDEEEGFLKVTKYLAETADQLNEEIQ
jgi:hypothetical protein